LLLFAPFLTVRSGYFFQVCWFFLFFAASEEEEQERRPLFHQQARRLNRHPQLFAYLCFNTQTQFYRISLFLQTLEMGDNANKDWEWHNNEVGIGYAAPGVVRQRRTGHATSKIIDMTKPIAISEVETSDKIIRKESTKKESKMKEDKLKKKRKKHKQSSSDSRPMIGPSFNPFLQAFASQISDTTRHFSVD
jgi:hypothetical protein